MTKIKKEWLLLILISTITVLYYSIGLKSWKYSFIGDDWAFFKKAKDIVDVNFQVNPFDMVGVYPQERLLGSVWQALWLKIFNFDQVLGWKFSNVVLIIPSLLFFYFWLKNTLNKTVAFYGLLFFSSSFYLANFFKIGYLNPISLFFLTTCLYFTDKALRTNKTLVFILLGFIFGISFYNYIGPIFIPVILISYLLADYKKLIKTWPKIGLCLIIVLVFVLIGVLTSKADWMNIGIKTVKKEFLDYNQILVNIGRNFILFYKNYDYFYNHYVVGPYLDIISRILATLGIIQALKNIKTTGFRTIIYLYITTAIVLGLINPYPYSPTTRGIFLLPFGFAFAAIGLYSIQKRCNYLLALLILAVFGINYYLGQYWVFQQAGYSRTNLLLREISNETKAGRKDFLILSSNNYNFCPNLVELSKWYKYEQIHCQTSSPTMINQDVRPNDTIIYFSSENTKETMQPIINSYKNNKFILITEKNY